MVAKKVYPPEDRRMDPRNLEYTDAGVPLNTGYNPKVHKQAFDSYDELYDMTTEFVIDEQ